MNQLSVAEKRFPRSHQDIAANFFALRKIHTGTRWTFTEGRNPLNPASHCDLAWAGALATHVHTLRQGTVGIAIALENGWLDQDGFHPYHSNTTLPPEASLLSSEDPAIWRRVG